VLFSSFDIVARQDLQQWVECSALDNDVSGGVAFSLDDLSPRCKDLLPLIFGWDVAWVVESRTPLIFEVDIQQLQSYKHM
jgi:hypothetical protein